MTNITMENNYLQLRKGLIKATSGSLAHLPNRRKFAELHFTYYEIVCFMCFDLIYVSMLRFDRGALSTIPLLFFDDSMMRG